MPAACGQTCAVPGWTHWLRGPLATQLRRPAHRVERDGIGHEAQLPHSVRERLRHNRGHTADVGASRRHTMRAPSPIVCLSGRRGAGRSSNR